MRQIKSVTGIALASAVIFLSACASSPSKESGAPQLAGAPAINLDAFTTLMSGSFQTAPDDPENNIQDRRVRITSSALEGTWLYYQLNTGPEKKLYRQRVIRLSINDQGDAIVQKTFRLKKPEDFINAWDKADLLEALSTEDIEPFFDEGCEQIWRKVDTEWHGYVDPATCKIFSERRQANISIEAEARLNAQTYRQTERGFDEKGDKLFGTEPGTFIVLYRQ